MKITLPTGRIHSIDAFRGLTIFLMVFVNELAGVQNIPAWMKHASADEDAMTFVDVVFPAFLFIVGMSMPFAIQRRLRRGDTLWRLTAHTLWRTPALLIMGVFMVNAEGGYDERLMGISIHAWSLFFYLAVLMLFVDWKSNKMVAIATRVFGALVLLALAFVYRDDAGGYITPRWWGILGLIGWAYLIGFVIYMMSQGRRWVIFLGVLIGFAYYVLGHFAFRGNIFYQHALFSQGWHAIHTAIVLAGMLASMMIFHEDPLLTRRARLANVGWFSLLMLLVGFSLRPLFGISKIYATPSWAAFSVISCIVVFCLLYVLSDNVRIMKLFALFEPAATNPLLVYIIPYIVYALMQYFGFSMPDLLYTGLSGIAWCLAYAALIMLLGGWLTRRGLIIKL